MIAEGLKLTVLGMGVVYLFLALLMLLIGVSARLCKPLSDREALAAETRAARRPRAGGAPDKGGKIKAVIGAAVAAHRARSRPN